MVELALQDMKKPSGRQSKEFLNMKRKVLKHTTLLVWSCPVFHGIMFLSSRFGFRNENMSKPTAAPTSLYI